VLRRESGQLRDSKQPSLTSSSISLSSLMSSGYMLARSSGDDLSRCTVRCSRLGPSLSAPALPPPPGEDRPRPEPGPDRPADCGRPAERALCKPVVIKLHIRQFGQTDRSDREGLPDFFGSTGLTPARCSESASSCVLRNKECE
jgi:hypothetical protein